MNAPIRMPLTVLRSVWLDGGGWEPPQLEMELSDGRFIKVGYDLEFSHPLVWIAPDKHADFESAPARESGLGDALEPYIDEVAHAARLHEADRMADEDDGRCDEERP